MLSDIATELLGLTALLVTAASLAASGVAGERAERILGAVWPDLWRLRRRVIPRIERAVPPLYAVGWAGKAQFVGVIDASPVDVRRHLRHQRRVYPGTLASLQWTAIDGERVLEVGSYAMRPEGLFGKWQYHIRVFPVPGEPERARIAAHKELNPWFAPVRHYRAVNFDVEAGEREARALLDGVGAWVDESDGE